MIFSIDLYSTKRNTFILKCFIQFICTNLGGCQKEGVTLLICFRKRGYPERGGGPNLEETMANQSTVCKTRALF